MSGLARQARKRRCKPLADGGQCLPLPGLLESGAGGTRARAISRCLRGSGYFGIPRASFSGVVCIEPLPCPGLIGAVCLVFQVQVLEWGEGKESSLGLGRAADVIVASDVLYAFAASPTGLFAPPPPRRTYTYYPQRCRLRMRAPNTQHRCILDNRPLRVGGGGRSGEGCTLLGTENRN